MLCFQYRFDDNITLTCFFAHVLYINRKTENFYEECVFRIVKKNSLTLFRGFNIACV